eukprot:TRINITY_DN781848_c0_g1_i1.p1 TRINITY_DN781848_c0_g1~~TRINITY_DN781848_c0_g1_i1.p1  ORF type:complete len:528 (-),score=153.25 TRINITY_DN781848_c0_g1_i1:249-1832(-)
MNSLFKYGDSDSDSEPETYGLKMTVRAAPDVDLGTIPVHESAVFGVDVGPANPFNAAPHMYGGKTTATGTMVEDFHMEPIAFEEQMHKANNSILKEHNKKVAVNEPGRQMSRKRRRPQGKPEDINSWKGPWAGYEGEVEDRRSMFEKGTLTEEQEAYRQEHMEKKRKKTERREGRAPEDDIGEGMRIEDCKSVFHGKEEKDYQNRAWCLPPTGVKSSTNHKCFVPKRIMYTYKGHSKGVNSIAFYPKIGHLLLSGALDGKVKIWDVETDKKCRRTYIGHNAGVRHVSFTPTGEQFLTCSFDRHAKLWDLETGKCVSTFTNGRVPNQACFHPTQEHTFLVASSNKQVLQYDTRSGKKVLHYDYHLGPCNTVAFIDGARRFVSTGDDKQMLIWDFNNPAAPTKIFSDPTMFSYPYVAVHPNDDHFICQSLENNIFTFQCADSVRKKGRKVFKGHTVAGYACQTGFSADGKIVLSGDGNGKLWFWKWNSSKLIRQIKGHNSGPSIGAVWHPRLPSRVASCGWDGDIHLWD